MPQIVCGQCGPCLRGDEHICDALRVQGFQAPGCAQELWVTSADKIVKLPDSFSFEQGALESNTYGVDCNWVVNPAHILWLKAEEIIPWYVLEHSSYIYIPQILADMAETINGTAPCDVVNRVSLDEPDGQSYEMEVDDDDSVEFQEAVRVKNATLLPLPRSSS